MAPTGQKAFARMDSADSCSTEESVLVEEEEQATPAIHSTKSNDRLFHEGRRRRGLLALMVVGVATMALYSWNAMGKGPHTNAGDGQGETDLSERHGKKSSHVADMQESAVVSLASAESLPDAVMAVAATKAKALRGSFPKGAAAASRAPSTPPAEDGKEQSLQASDMPGAEFADDKSASLAASDFPGAQDKKEQSLDESNVPGAREVVAASPAAPPAALPAAAAPVQDSEMASSSMSMGQPVPMGATGMPDMEALGDESLWKAMV